MSRELTIAWAKRNCLDPRVARDIAHEWDEATRDGDHVVLLVGEKLTRSGASHLVASLAREIFVFELTNRQARHLDVVPGALGVRTGRGQPGPVMPEPPVALTNLHIDNAGAQVAAQPVTGHVDYELADPALSSFALRMVYDLPYGTTVIHFDHFAGPLPGRRTLHFKMSPLQEPHAELKRPLPGTMLVFFNLCLSRAGADAPDVAVSNTCAALIDPM